MYMNMMSVVWSHRASPARGSISEGPIQGNIDFFKDLLADANALETDVIKEEQFYGDAFTKPLFTRPTGTRDVQFSDILVGALPFLVAASASLNQGSKK